LARAGAAKRGNTALLDGTPEELRKLQIAEIEKYKRIAQAANIKTD